jgi:hypothetical protein
MSLTHLGRLWFLGTCWLRFFVHLSEYYTPLKPVTLLQHPLYHGMVERSITDDSECGSKAIHYIFLHILTLLSFCSVNNIKAPRPPTQQRSKLILIIYFINFIEISWLNNWYAFINFNSLFFKVVYFVGVSISPVLVYLGICSQENPSDRTPSLRFEVRTWEVLKRNQECYPNSRNLQWIVAYCKTLVLG